jgi:hypothetical protein
MLITVYPDHAVVPRQLFDQMYAAWMGAQGAAAASAAAASAATAEAVARAPGGD